MDVFAAVNTRIACRAFLDKPVDLNIVRELIVRAQRAASGGNLQSWNVYALANKPMRSLARVRVGTGVACGALSATDMGLWCPIAVIRRR